MHDNDFLKRVSHIGLKSNFYYIRLQIVHINLVNYQIQVLLLNSITNRTHKLGQFSSSSASTNAQKQIIIPFQTKKKQFTLCGPHKQKSNVYIVSHCILCCTRVTEFRLCLFAFIWKKLNSSAQISSYVFAFI